MMKSASEENGLAEIQPQDQRIYSVGISTGGSAEMQMADRSPSRKIIATTVDAKGAKFANAQIEEAGLQNQIEVKLENVADPLPYNDEFFDFIYARLVLHYLSKQQLIQALSELYRVLKRGGKIFVVVRSPECIQTKAKNFTYNPETCMTLLIFENGYQQERFFHTPDSIQHFMTSAGFAIEHVKQYYELLCHDFERKIAASEPDDLIEVLAQKRV